jgi:hypothetical protein
VQRKRLPERDYEHAPMSNDTNLTSNRDFELVAEFLGSQEYFQRAQTTETNATIPGCTPTTPTGPTPANLFAGIPVSLRF